MGLTSVHAHKRNTSGDNTMDVQQKQSIVSVLFAYDQKTNDKSYININDSVDDEIYYITLRNGDGTDGEYVVDVEDGTVKPVMFYKTDEQKRLDPYTYMTFLMQRKMYKMSKGQR